MKHCAAYRRRGPTWNYVCEDDFAGDRIPETGCRDPRVIDAYLQRPVTGPCAPAAAGCA